MAKRIWSAEQRALQGDLAAMQGFGKVGARRERKKAKGRRLVHERLTDCLSRLRLAPRA